jgi:hypothetical protein
MGMTKEGSRGSGLEDWNLAVDKLYSYLYPRSTMIPVIDLEQMPFFSP